MKKILKKLCFALTVLSMGVTAQAAWEQSGDDEITVNLELGSEYAEKMVTIDVFLDGKKAEDLLDENVTDYFDIIVNRNQGTADENGNFSYSFKNSGNSGRYIAYISVEGMEDYLTEEIDFVNIAQFKKAVSDINTELEKSSPSYSAIAKLIEDNKESFGIADEVYEDFSSIDKSDMAKILSNIAGGELNPEERETCIEQVKKAIFVQMLNENKILSVFEDLTVSELDKSDLSEWYNKDFVKEELKTDMTMRLSGRGFESFDEYKEALAESFVLATVKNPNGYKNIKTVAEAFKDEIGITVSSSVSDTVWTKLAGEDFDDYDDFADKYNDLKSGNSKSTGGGSGSTGGGSKNTATSNMVTTAPVKAPLEELTVEETAFSDLQDGHWAKDAVTALAKQGIISGREDSKFEPDAYITREEFVKLITSCIASDDLNTDVEFDDVDKNGWYYEYVKKAYNTGLVTGYSDRVFGIGDLITRQDMAAICYRVYKAKTGISQMEKDGVFSDDAMIADYAKDAVYTLKSLGIISGMPNNEFCPAEATTRAQAAVIINKLLSV